MKATKDYKLLSFGDEAEEEEVVLKDVQVTAMKQILWKYMVTYGWSVIGHISTQKIAVSTQAKK